jgi:hypothetical protein
LIPKRFKTDHYSSTETNALLDIVQEYLLKSGYFKSLDSFQHDINTHPNLVPYTRNSTGNSRFGEDLLLEVNAFLNLDI